MPGESPTGTASPWAPLPATLTIPGGAGCSATAMFNAAAAPGQTVLTVGPGKEYQTIAAAVQAAANGDLILVQPGTYTDDFADITRSVTIAGAGGLVTIDAAEAPPNEKGIFVIDASVQIDNVVFEGAAIPVSEGGNGAGIRYQGGAMVLHNDAFIGNQNGILAAAVDNLPVNTITITGCTFDNNGNSTGPDAGFTHNCYISTGVTTLTATHDVFERANVGHELKSRAQTNIITNNIFYDGPTGTASYSIDLPDGGRDTVSGNIIEKGPEAENDAIIPYAGSTLSITGNTIINDLGANAVLLLNQTTIAASIMHNTLDKFAGATIGQGVYTQSGNVDQNGDPIAPSSSGSFAPGTNLDDFSQDSSPHTVTLTSQTGVLGGGGLLTVFTQAGHVTVVGGAGGLDYQEAAGFGGSQITTAAGARDTVVAPGQDQIASNGRDSITLGNGNVTMQVDGAASIAAGSGNSAFVVNGQASITGGDGGDTVQVNGPGAASIGGALSYLQVAMNGGSAALGVSQGGGLDQMTIRGGASETAIYNAGMNVTTAGAGAGAAISFGSGTAVVLSNGADTIHAGSGADTVIVSASAQVYAGSGTLSVFGRSETGQASVYAAGGSVYLAGDTGGIVYFGGAMANALDAVLSNVTLRGGAGLMSVTGGSDQDVMGGSGGLVFASSGGADTITTTAGAHDTLNFAGCCEVVSNGTDLIDAGWGNSTVTANGAATINGSTGNAFYCLNGADSLNGYGYTRATVGAGASDSVTAYGSLTAVTVSAGGTLVFGQVSPGGPATATVTGAGATLVSSPGNAPDVTLSGTGDTAVLGTGPDSVMAQATGVQIWAGTGPDSVTVFDGGGTVHAGSGALALAVNDWVDPAVTVIDGGSGALTTSNGYGNILFVGGSGTADLGGTNAGETVMAGSGNMTLLGGGAGTDFTAGSGSASVTLTAGGGTVTLGPGTAMITEAAWGAADRYVFNSGAGAGNDTIAGFRTGTDALVFNGVSVIGTNSMGGSTQLTLSDGTHVTLLGVASWGH